MNADLQPVFRALADPTRRDILMLLSQQDMTIAEVAAKFEISRGAVKKHLLILEEGSLLSVECRGRERVNRLEADALRPVIDWVSYFNGFWDQRLDALKQAVETNETR